MRKNSAQEKFGGGGKALNDMVAMTREIHK